jgi:hypothetical protein
MTARIPIINTPHPSGHGVFSWHTLANGKHVSVLDNDYEYADDYEIHERLGLPSSPDLDADEWPRVVEGTERRAATPEQVEAVLAEIESS